MGIWIISPISAVWWHGMRAIGKTLNTSRRKLTWLKHSVWEVKAGISSYIENTINTNNAVAEGSQDIAKLVGWLPYKVRMVPSSTWTNSILSKKWDAIYISEKIFNSPEFKKQLKLSIDIQWLSIDTNKLNVNMDNFWRMQFSYLGKFSNTLLDQFWEGTPTHIAITEAIKNLITIENKKICTKIILWHILKENISKNNRNINGDYEWKKYSFSLDDAAQLITDEESNEKASALSQIIENQWFSLTEIKDNINKDISPKNIISNYPDWRKIMDKSFYLRENNFYSFEKAEKAKESNSPIAEDNTKTLSLNQDKEKITNSQSEEFENTKTQIEDIINSFNNTSDQINFIENMINNAPNISKENFPMYIYLMQKKTALTSSEKLIGKAA